MATAKNQQMKLVGEALSAAIEAIGGEPREGQIQMAEAVANALTDRHHLLVQAGTGTGKKVLVATATLALQRQLVERDLPKIQPALEKVLKRKLTFAVYKGVGNYLCLQKMNGTEQDPEGEFLMEIGALEKDQKRLKAWASTPGVSGDRDDAPEVDRRVWFANSVSGRECIGKDDCAFGSQCFSVAAKAKAQTADVVVTNHTLLAIEIVDSHSILPERDAVILDEAHEFMDRTTQAVTEELTAARVERAAKMAAKHIPSKATIAFNNAADEFAEAIADYAADIRSDPTKTGRLIDLPRQLEGPIRKIKETATAVVALIAADAEVIDTDTLAQRGRVKGATNEILQIASKMLKQGAHQVMWFEPVFSTLYLAPLEVSDVLRRNLLTESPVIATSATLTIGKSFDAIAKSIGFVVGQDISEESEESKGAIDPANVQMLDVGSPFDFASQGMLYLPRHLAEPGRDGPAKDALTELGELIEAAGGRTLALWRWPMNICAASWQS
jgi:ATP-dependent DNA helicase DinG